VELDGGGEGAHFLFGDERHGWFPDEGKSGVKHDKWRAANDKRRLPEWQARRRFTGLCIGKKGGRWWYAICSW
jgi:hypothetical protein